MKPTNRQLGGTLLGSVMLLAGPTTSHATGLRPSADGQTIASLLAMQEMPVSELVARHKVVEVAEHPLAKPIATPSSVQRAAPPHTAASASIKVKERVLSEGAVGELMVSEVELGSLLNAADSPLASSAVARSQASKQSKGLAVQVVIPAASLDEADVEAKLVPAVAQAAPMPAVPGIDAKVVGKDIVASPTVAAVSRPAASPADAGATETQSLAAAAIAGQTPVAADEQHVSIVEKGQELSFSPQTLALSQIGDKAVFDFSAKSAQNMQVFVRDAHILRWDLQAREAVALRAGATELYVVHGGKLYILPVVVDKVGDQIDLQIPGALVSLNGLLPGELSSSALYPGIDAAPLAEKTDPNAPSLTDSIADTTRTIDEAERDYRRYSASSDQQSYGTLTMQVVDERSSPAAGEIYPASGVNLQVIGTEFLARTDQTGHLSIRDMPLQSRFFVALSDPAGQIAPSVFELSTRDGKRGVVRVRGIRSFTLDAYASITGVPPDANLASLCGTVSEDGENVGGVTVSLDIPANGPFYFNSLGLLDRAQRVTGSNGRYCFLNVLPGPIVVKVADSDTLVASVPTAVFPGRHSEVDLALDGEVSLQTRLAMLPSAHDQLSGDARLANALKTIDMIDLIPLGDSSPMAQLAPGLVESADPLVVLDGRVWAFAQAAEFEPTVYSFGADRRDAVTPLLPRGFIEDMSLYAQVAHDPALGAVVVEYGGRERDDNGSVTIKLVDADGQAVGEPWYYADQPATKAIFFNVPPGAYAALVETGDGFWLGGDTLLVYSETASYLRVGSRLRYQP